jgi:histidinol-phosphate aminotransferase
MSAAESPYPAPQTPGALAARYQLGLDRIVKLDANESPWGPPPAARAAVARLLATDGGAALGGMGRYPDALSTDLRAALADYTGVPAQGIVVGNGSDEIIQLLIEAFVGPGDAVIVSEPTFSVYGALARRAGARVVDVGRDEQWRTLPDAVASAMDAQTRLVFLCAPNNPTGTPLDRATFDAALARADELADGHAGAGPIIVVDEAYYEIGALAGDPRAWTAAPVVATESTHGRVVVLRTFSKLFGLAGLRMGYGLCALEVAARLLALRAPYNANLAGQVAALAALGDLAWLRERAGELVNERERLGRALTERLGLCVWPSAANFLLVDVTPDVTGSAARLRRGETLWRALLSHGVLIRRPMGPRLAGLLRVTVGLPEQNEAFCAALAASLTAVRRQA